MRSQVGQTLMCGENVSYDFFVLTPVPAVAWPLLYLFQNPPQEHQNHHKDHQNNERQSKKTLFSTDKGVGPLADYPSSSRPLGLQIVPPPMILIWFW